MISTTHLLLAVERSLQKTEDSGKAMVFGSFIRQGQATSDNAAV